ncbi:MAG: type IV secretory system conjugative DNA transfer family protein [Actinobacteria bacterium]|nr:type IV secretory system conjugative DNA transfer family protein [Actinomycetota bacterium]
MSTYTARPGRQQRPEVWENFLLIAVLAVLGIGLVLWAAGEVAGYLSSGKWPGGSLSQMGRVLARLTETPGDPGQAWPRRGRSVMPGPVLFYGVLTTFVVAAGILCVAAWRLFRRFLGAPTSATGSKWATPADLRSLVVSGPTRARLVLGRVGSKLIAAEERQSVIVLGPTQSMKTTGFAIPSILEWQGPVLATSVKTDLLRDTISQRSSRGDAWVYDPTSSTEYPTSRWSPLEMCGDWRGAQRTASWLAGATRTNGSGLSDADFWYAASAKLLGPHLFAAAKSGRTMADVVRWVNTQEEKEVREALQAAGVPEALDAAMASWKREQRQKSSVYTTVETVLNAYEDPVVARSAASCDISPEVLLDGSSRTLYIVSPSHEQRRLRPLFETLLQTVINYAFELSSRTGRPLDPPLLVVLDEAANIAPLRDLDTLASTAASHGIQLVSVFQDLAQLSTRYGERAQTVVNNHRAKIVLSGISDTQTLEYASRLLGDEEVMQSSITRSAQGPRSTTESMAMRSIAPAHVLRSIRPGEGVLVYGHLPAARIRLRPWFNEKSLSQA